MLTNVINLQTKILNHFVIYREANYRTIQSHLVRKRCGVLNLISPTTIMLVDLDMETLACTKILTVDSVFATWTDNTLKKQRVRAYKWHFYRNLG